MTAINEKKETKVTIVIISILAAYLWITGPNTALGKSEDGPMQSRYLLLDSRIIQSTQNAKLALGTVTKDKHNPLFVEDRPWEPRYDNVYANVIYDHQEKIYKCWYSPFIIDERTTSSPLDERNPTSREYMRVRPNHREMGVCYAVSKDGIRWKKPELGLIEFDGSTKNNLLMRGKNMRGMFHGPHGAGVIKDLHETDPARRYKMFFRAEKMAVAFSPDGIHWDSPVLCTEISAPGDTHNNAFWDPATGKYVGITRLKTKGNIRLVGRTESPDFVNWTKAQVVLQGVKPQLQTHDMVVFKSGGVYIGLLGIMDFPKAGSNYHVKQHVELAWSHDSKQWHRIQQGTPFIDHTPAKNEEAYGKMPYDWGTIFASAPIFLEDKVQIYYGACDWYFFDWRIGYLALATIRPDGWAGYEQTEGDKPAFITTKPIACTGGKLQLSADVEKGGFVRAILIDKEIVVSKPINKTVTDAMVKWEGGFSLEKFKGKNIRLKFELNNAKLYSFGFDLKSQAKIISEQSKSAVDSKDVVEKIAREIVGKQQKALHAQKQKELAEQQRLSQPPEEQVPGFINDLKDADPRVREKAADELGKIAQQVKDEKALNPAVAPLVAAMSDDDMQVRDESAEALGNIASRIKDQAAIKSTIETLIKALSDKSAEVREEAAEALWRIASKVRDKTLLQPAVQSLKKSLRDKEQEIADFAARALESIGTPEAKAALKARK